MPNKNYPIQSQVVCCRGPTPCQCIQLTSEVEIQIQIQLQLQKHLNYCHKWGIKVKTLWIQNHTSYRPWEIGFFNPGLDLQCLQGFQIHICKISTFSWITLYLFSFKKSPLLALINFSVFTKKSDRQILKQPSLWTDSFEGKSLCQKGALRLDTFYSWFIHRLSNNF